MTIGEGSVDARYTFFVQTDIETGEMSRMGLGLPFLGKAILRGSRRMRSLAYDELFIGGRWQAPPPGNASR